MSMIRNPRLLMLVSLVLLLVSCTNYGKKVSKEYLDVFYKDGITEEQANATLNYLFPSWKNQEGGEDEKKSVQLTKTGDTINFRMVINPVKMAAIGDNVIADMSNELSEALFNKAPVNVELTDNKFKLIRIIRYVKGSGTARHGKKVVSGNIEVYAKDGFDETLAKKLATYIDTEDRSADTKSFQVLQGPDGYIVRMVTTEQSLKLVDEQTFNAMARLFSENVFNGSTLEFQVTDNQFTPVKSFYYPAGTAPSR